MLSVCHSPQPFSDLACRVCMAGVHRRDIHVYIDKSYVIITEITTPTKRFLIIHVELVYHILLLIHSELKQQVRSYTPEVPSKTIPRIPKGRHIPIWLL